MSQRTRASAAVGEEFLDALKRRDYAALAVCFTDDATLRAIVPPGVREDEGPESIVQRFRLWTEEIEDYQVSDCEAIGFADVLRLRWSVRGNDPGADFAPSTFEQSAYADLRDGRIAAMRLACSGDRPVS